YGDAGGDGGDGGVAACQGHNRTARGRGAGESYRALRGVPTGDAGWIERQRREAGGRRWRRHRRDGEGRRFGDAAVRGGDGDGIGRRYRDGCNGEAGAGRAARDGDARW